MKINIEKEFELKLVVDTLIKDNHPILAKRVIEFWRDSTLSWVDSYSPELKSEIIEIVAAVCIHYNTKENPIHDQ